MSVPSSISQLSTTASLNSPAGTEPIGNNLAPYLNTAFAFIAQLRDGTGLNVTQALNMNSFQINNVAAATANTDAVNYLQLKSLIPIGTIFTWSGSVANIPSVWGSNYSLCDGTNGTPDLRNRFVIGAGGSYTPGTTGGAATVTLTTANLPAHNHGVNDPTHAHSIADPGHNHGVNDPGHTHTLGMNAAPQSGSSTFCYVPSDMYGKSSPHYETVNASGTGIWLNASGTGIGIYGAATGITIQNTGSGASFGIQPPFYSLCYVMKISSN